jgi:preprotein translocase subunit Sss1
MYKYHRRRNYSSDKVVVRGKGNPTRPGIVPLPEYTREDVGRGRAAEERSELRFKPLPEYLRGGLVREQRKKGVMRRIIEDVRDDVARPVYREVRDKLVKPIYNEYIKVPKAIGLAVLGVGGVVLISQGYGHLVDPIMRQASALMAHLAGNKVIDFANMAIGYGATTVGLNLVNKVLPERLNKKFRIDKISNAAMVGGGIAALGLGIALPAIGLHIGPTLVENWRVKSHLTGLTPNNAEIAAASLAVGGTVGVGLRSLLRAWSD